MALTTATTVVANAERLLQFVNGDAFKTQLVAYGFDPLSTP